jgi:hypothetical protein
LEPDRQQHGRPTACVVAPQYSSATFISLHFHYRKENLERLSKILLFLLFFLTP